MRPSKIKSPAPALVWLRRDLRLLDNPVLAAAAASGMAVIPVFIDDEPQLGGAARWWRGRSLAALGNALDAIGSKLTLRRGDALDHLMSLVDETGAREIHFNRRFEPAGLADDARIMTDLRGRGIEVHEHDGNRLHQPWSLKTLKGDPFRVFTPFWKQMTCVPEGMHLASCAAAVAVAELLTVSKTTSGFRPRFSSVATRTTEPGK